MFREVWKPIPGYEGLYEVSDLGRVKSIKYGKEMILRPGKTRKGYLRVGLYKDEKRKYLYVHRLVWEAFNGPIPKGMQINHLSEEKTDCRLENLSLVSCRENINWGSHNRRVGKALSKMVEQHTLDNIHICTWFSINAVKGEGFDPRKVCMCCQGKRSKHKGFTWKYA